MPIPVIPVVVAVSALLAISGVVYGCDQANKREEEQKRTHDENANLKKRISELEQKHDHLLPVLGEKNHQVRVLADEIRRLRAELEEAHRRAA